MYLKTVWTYTMDILFIENLLSFENVTSPFDQQYNL